MVLTTFDCLLVAKIVIKFLLASLKSLTNSKNPSSYPLQEACSGAWQPVTLKTVPNAAFNSENCSESRL
jgi:hypothetical protein